jgi:hypothetical protein
MFCVTYQFGTQNSISGIDFDPFRLPPPLAVLAKTFATYTKQKR